MSKNGFINEESQDWDSAHWPGLLHHRYFSVNLVTVCQVSSTNWTYWAFCPNRSWFYFHPHVPPTVSWDANFFLHCRTSGPFPRCWRLSVETLPSTKSPFWKRGSSARVIFYPVYWHALPSFKALHLLYHLQVFCPYCQIFLHIFPLWAFPSSLPKHRLWSLAQMGSRVGNAP